MFLGRSIIEHADENFFVNINAIRHGNNQKNHPQLVQNRYQKNFFQCLTRYLKILKCKNNFYVLHVFLLSPLFWEGKLNLPPVCYKVKWFKVTNILDNLKISTWSMIFYIFYSNFSLNDSLENAVSEDLKWLKFQKFSEGSAPKPLQGRLLHHQQLYHTLLKTKQK